MVSLEGTVTISKADLADLYLMAGMLFAIGLGRTSPLGAFTFLKASDKSQDSMRNTLDTVEALLGVDHITPTDFDAANKILKDYGVRMVSSHAGREALS